MKTLKIVLMTKNERYLIEPWIRYHGDRFGYRHLHVLDDSDDADVLSFYANFAKPRGVDVFACHSNLNEMESHINQKMQSIRQDCDFMIKMDTDEFLGVWDGGSRSVSIDRETIQSAIDRLPVDGRRYRCSLSMNAIPEEKNGRDILKGCLFTKPFKTTFKAFFPSKTFEYCDLGGHDGAVSYPHNSSGFHETNLFIIHFQHQDFESYVANSARAALSHQIFLPSDSLEVAWKKSDVYAKAHKASFHKAAIMAEFFVNPNYKKEYYASHASKDAFFFDALARVFSKSETCDKKCAEKETCDKKCAEGKETCDEKKKEANHGIVEEKENAKAGEESFGIARVGKEGNRKCIVITTIQAPTLPVHGYSLLKDWDLIVVGDAQTPDLAFREVSCVYLGLSEQEKLFPSFFPHVPPRSYGRKMFGYLYAIRNGYEVIYDTDDDNWCELLEKNCFAFLRGEGNNVVNKTTYPNQGFVNIYRLFTDQHIWPRGIPFNHPSVKEVPKIQEKFPKKDTSMRVAVIQGLVNGDPDVDAVYRLERSKIDSSDEEHGFFFEKSIDWVVALEKGSVCPFNSQNTFWVDSSAFRYLYLPVTVSFRYTDILRSFIALHRLWEEDKTVAFTAPTAVQKRNEHDLQNDLESERSMQETAERVVNLLRENPGISMEETFSLLCRDGVVRPEEVAAWKAWEREIHTIS